MPAALIKVADADAAINHTADASKGYRAAACFADKAGDKALESLAIVHLADLQEKQADIREEPRSLTSTHCGSIRRSPIHAAPLPTGSSTLNSCANKNSLSATFLPACYTRKTL